LGEADDDSVALLKPAGDDVLKGMAGEQAG
jgi:hypothetical protein